MSRNAAGISNFGRSNFGISNLGISNFGASKAAAAALLFPFGVVVASVMAIFLTGRLYKNARTPPPWAAARNTSHLPATVKSRWCVTTVPSTDEVYIALTLVHCNRKWCNAQKPRSGAVLD